MARDQRAYQAAWYQANKEQVKAKAAAWRLANPDRRRQQAYSRYQLRLDWLNAFKIERGCADCGYHASHTPLQFDHVRGTKTANVGSLLSRPMAVLQAEIDKCDVVCANCHCFRTERRRRGKD